MPMSSTIHPVDYVLGEVEELMFTEGEVVPLDEPAKRLKIEAYTRVNLDMDRVEFAMRGSFLSVFSATALPPVLSEFFGDETAPLKDFQTSDQRTHVHVLNTIGPPHAGTAADPLRVPPRESLGRFHFHCLGNARIHHQRHFVRRHGMPDACPGEPFGTSGPHTSQAGSDTPVRPGETTELRRRLCIENERVPGRKLAYARVELQRDSAPQLRRSKLPRLSVTPRQPRIFRTADGGPHQHHRGHHVSRPYAARRLEPERMARGRCQGVRNHRRPARNRLPDHLHCSCGRHLGQAQTLDQHYHHRECRRHELSGHNSLVNKPAKIALPPERDPTDRTQAVTEAKTLNRDSKAFDFADLKKGECVVHVQQGFDQIKIERLRTFGSGTNITANEYLDIVYWPSRRRASSNKLFIPTHQLDQVSKYDSAEAPMLEKLSNADWASTMSMSHKHDYEITDDPIKLHSARERAKGFAYSPDTPREKGLEDTFLYLVTAHQLTTIDGVKSDTEKPLPMDRLICVHVGFCIAEFALLAAFKTEQDAKQVTENAPTTLPD